MKKKQKKKLKKKRKKKDNEVDKNDLYVQPENAISVDDYLKSKKLEETEKKDFQRPKETEELKEREVNKAAIIGTTQEKKKKKHKVSEKKVNKEEEDFDKNFYENINIGGNVSNKQNTNKNNRNRRERGNYHQKKEQFVYNPEDFPKMS